MNLRNMTMLTMLTTMVFGVLTPAFAQRNVKEKVAIKPLVKYRDWSVYKHKINDDLMCFAISSPKDMIPKEVKRAEVLFYVTRWKSNPKKAQISIKIGYPFKEGSKPDIKIKTQEFKLFVKGDKAWIRDEGDEALLLKSMRRGSKMTVIGMSSEGIMTTDQYSLSGITKALNKVKQLCR